MRLFACFALSTCCLTFLTPSQIPAATASSKAQQKISGSQRQATVDSVRALRKLLSAVEVGLSFSQYTDRLIDAKAEIDERFSLLPEGVVKQEIAGSMDAFLDAHELWRLSLTEKWAHSYLFHARQIYKRYNFTPERNADADVKIGEELRRWRKEPLVDDALMHIWAVAVQHLQRAQEKLASSNK